MCTLQKHLNYILMDTTVADRQGKDKVLCSYLSQKQILAGS